MSRTQPRRRLPARLIAALAALLAALAVVIVPQSTPVAIADAGVRGGDYVPFSAPRMLFDTRGGTPKGPGSVATFPVLGVGGVPSSGVRAVLVRIIGIPTANTWLTLYPDGEARPGVSMLNVSANMALSNIAIVRPGANGRLAVFNAGGNTHIVVEVQGYFTTATGSTWGGLVPVTQQRVVDTRNGVGTPAGTIAPNASRTVNLATAGVPAGATAAFVELTVPSTTTTTAPGWFVATPGASAAAGLGIINYENGIHSASGAAVPLASDGRVTFTNKGTKPAHLIIDTMAYFTRTATAGAGFRPVTSRLHGSTVPANGVIDVVVGGTNGMPTRGVAAAALSLQSGGTDFGALRAWPTGAPEPGTSLTQHHANATSRASAIVTPGVDGKVRIKNISDAPSLVYIDMEGWFANPLPAIPVVQNSPVTVLQPAPAPGQSLGTVEYAYVNNIGELFVGHQPDPTNFGSIQYSRISGNEAFTGRPALSRRPDGTVQVAAQHTDGGDIWATSQTAVGAATWKAWSDLGGSMAAPPAAAVLSNNATVLFAVDVDGRLWAYAETGSVPFWRNLGDVNLTGSPAAVPVGDGVQVFARGADGSIATILYRTDGSVSPWTNLGGTGTGAPAAVVYPGYVLRVFARAADNTITTKKQDPATGTFPAAWDPVGSFVAAGDPSAILDPVLGRTAVVARGQDNLVYVSWETAEGSGVFGDWDLANTSAIAAATDPTVAPVSNGTTQFWIIVYRTLNGSVAILERRVPGAAGAPFAATTSPTPAGQ